MERQSWRHRHRRGQSSEQFTVDGPFTLAQIQPGSQVVIRSSGLDPACAASCRAWHPAGPSVTVLQHAPETVVQVEYTELAFSRNCMRAPFAALAQMG